MKVLLVTILVLGVIAINASSDYELSDNQVDWFKGEWLASDFDNSTIKIYKAKNGFWYGKILTSDNPEFVDKLILKKATYDTKKAALVGTIYHPELLVSIHATLTKEKEKKLKLVGTRFLMTKTFYWTRKN